MRIVFDVGAIIIDVKDVELHTRELQVRKDNFLGCCSILLFSWGIKLPPSYVLMGLILMV